MIAENLYGRVHLLLDVSVKSTVLFGLAGVSLCVLRVRNANVQHRVWTAVLAGMLLMPLLVPVVLVSAGLEPTDQGSSISGTAGNSEPVAAANQGEPQPPQPTNDSLQDPLPEGARPRLGTLRFRHPSSVHELALSPDEKSIVTIASEELIVWDAATGKDRWRANLREVGIDLPHGVAYGMQALAFSSSDNSTFCTPGNRGEFIMWDLASGGHKTVPYKNVLPVDLAIRQSDAVKAVDVSADAKKIAVGSGQGVIVWGEKGQVLLSVANKPEGRVEPKRMNSDRLWFGGHYSFGRFSPDGKVIAVVTSDAPTELRLFDCDAGQELRRITLTSNLVRLAFSRDGKQIVTTERDVAVRLYATESGERIWSREIEPAKNAESYTCAVAYSPDAKTIAVCAPIGPDNAIYLLGAARGDIVGKLIGSTWKPWGLAFTADSKTLYSLRAGTA